LFDRLPRYQEASNSFPRSVSTQRFTSNPAIQLHSCIFIDCLFIVGCGKGVLVTPFFSTHQPAIHQKARINGEI
jgi:hypothetical protein